MSKPPFLNHQTSLPGMDVTDHSNRGKVFERWLMAAHSEYAARGWAQIDRHATNWEYISDKEYQSMIERGKREYTAVTGANRKMAMVVSNVDFSGVAKGKLLKKGVSVKFDAKMCRGNRIPLDSFKLHQVDNLIEAERCGAIAGFMIYFWGLVGLNKEPVSDRIFFCPPMLVRDYFDRRVIRSRAKQGEGSIHISEIEEKGVRISMHGNFIDWLPALLPQGF